MSRMFTSGKLIGRHAGDRDSSADDNNSVDKFQILLDFVLQNAVGDERPYLTVDILGKSVLGLLDSGASKTIMGSKGLSIVRDLGLVVDSSKKTNCTVANGDKCQSVGVVELPITLRGKCRLIEAFVVPELPHVLILGVDFWRMMGLVPDLRRNEWHFSDEPITINTVEQMSNQTLLSHLENQRLQAVLDRNFALMDQELGCTDQAEHLIVTESPPIKQRYYRANPIIQAEIDKQLDEMLRLGVVEASNSPWSSPIVLVKKKDGTYRFCVDFRKLNSVTVRDSYPLPLVADTLDKLRNAKYLSSLDIKSAYWQIPMAESAKQYTAFTVPNRGLFQFKRMPFGLHNSAATWQRFIDKVIGHDLEPFVFVYLDDIVIVSDSFERHLAILEEVFRRLREAKVTISKDKCQFCRPQMKYLGYVVDRNGLHVDPEKVNAMLEIKPPKTVREVRRLVGTFSWYRRFVPEFSSVIAPITNLLKKKVKFDWTEECDRAFRKIKECLVTAPVLSCPDYSKPFVVQTDASSYGIGAVLTQPHEDGERVIAYLSRSLTRQEQAYSVTEQECLAVLWAVEKLRPYLEGVEFTVVTDHYSLLWLQNLKNLNGRLARWSVRLQQYNFKIVHRKGKDNVVPDMLSRAVPVLDVIGVEQDIRFDSSGDKWYQKMVESVRRNPLKFGGWREREGQLWKHVGLRYPNLSPPGDSWKLVVPKGSRREVIAQAHEPPTSGHTGVFKTFSRIAEKYYWPKMRNDVSNFVRRCKVCSMHKVSQERPVDKMVSHNKADRPWEIVSTDLIGPLPRSKRGHVFILVVTDYLSKFSLLFPLRKATGDNVSKIMENEVFLMFGVPRVIICDNGPQYRCKQFLRLAESYKCRIQFNAAYHPRANPTERVNRNIKTMLAMYVSENHQTWDENIHKIACALRTSTHETTKLTPYFINFGRNMALSGADYLSTDTLTLEDGEQAGEKSRNEAFREMFADVRKRLEVAGKKSCDRYNLRCRNVEYLPNQVVYKRNYVLSDAAKFFSHKLAPRFVGPFYIRKRLSPWTYEIRDEFGNSKGIWHVKDLKPSPEDPEDN